MKTRRHLLIVLGATALAPRVGLVQSKQPTWIVEEAASVIAKYK